MRTNPFKSAIVAAQLVFFVLVGCNPCYSVATGFVSAFVPVVELRTRRTKTISTSTHFTTIKIDDSRSRIPTRITESSSCCSSSSSSALYAFLPDLTNNNPFDNFVFKGPQSLLGGVIGTTTDDRFSVDESAEFEPTSSGLIAQTKRLVSCDFGISDPSLLDDTKFSWIDANAKESVALSKTEYVAAGRYFNIRGAFPDIEYRAHDYRVAVSVDEGTDNTVRLTCRTKGTMRGELRLRNGVTIPPSGLVMKCPPEAVSVTFDLDTGKVTKLCTGFVLDRLVGNTGGTTGVVAASIIGGQPTVSDWDLYPPTTILSRVFARPAKPLDEAESFLAPFPEQVMVQLAKGVLGSSMGYDDPSLLSDKEFSFVTPTVGPISKREFLEKYAQQEFLNIEDPRFSAFRVDPYDPVRVWVDVQPSASGFEGPPQAMSFAFDDDGYCIRITSWAVMDPSIGNAGGLGGPEGYKYATGTASPGLASRSVPSLLGRFKKRVISPITGIKVDSYTRESGSNPFIPQFANRPSNVPPGVAAKKAVTGQETASEAVMKRLESIKEFGASIRIVPPSIPTMSVKTPSLSSTAVEGKKAKDIQQARKLAQDEKLKQDEAAAKAKAKLANDEKLKRDVAAKKAQEQQKIQKAKALEAKKSAAAADDARRQQQIEVQNKAAAAADEERRKKAQQLKKQQEAEKAEKEAEKLKRQAELEKNAKQAAILAKAEQRKKSTSAEEDQKRRQQAALDSLSNAASRATIALFGFGANKGEEDTIVKPPSASVRTTPPTKQQPPKQAPAGVPTLSRWRKNPDNSITGLVRGSKGFTDGSRVTTSPIKTGTISAGEIVKTGSGSRYFLE